MPSKSANVKNEKQYEKLKKKGMSKSRAARIANSPGAHCPKVSGVMGSGVRFSEAGHGLAACRSRRRDGIRWSLK